MDGGQGLESPVSALESNYTASSDSQKQSSLEMKTVYCDDCDKPFASKHKLRKHIAVHHLDYLHTFVRLTQTVDQYEACGDSFLRQRKLRKYSETHSSNTQLPVNAVDIQRIERPEKA
ncbi:hypothetical protein KIN20_017900 [Parelaphostrongylus tenuis]|uniref:C2H2-type domain-containing protein n=1 Tax=Parelaphostrongylus tenuis TaxID=148309 RepID=A0AAD5QRT4_PARTN|nr:hypothetical protein KIN20_017900 [Parelaphostrongylus tenuis]